MMWPLFHESSFMWNSRVPDPSYGMETSCKYITKINGIKKIVSQLAGRAES